MRKNLIVVALAFILTLVFLLPYGVIKQGNHEARVERSKDKATHLANDAIQIISEASHHCQYCSSS